MMSSSDFQLHFLLIWFSYLKLGLVMSRPLLLVSLLLLMVFTSQFEWNQLIVNEVEARPLVLSQKQQYMLEKEESVKEKVSPLPELCIS
ncbi:hypothetical protein HanOQP8_Chr01g0031471 [Helianthus annuus]|nr:hypothetical protein HanOQP8_Chr01g0031471 [Helianthus annuus]